MLNRNYINGKFIKRIITGYLILNVFYCLPVNAEPYVSKYNHTYYISLNGNDNNNGDKDHPWKTVGKLNRTALKPGTIIYFSGGQVFDGTISLDSVNGGENDQPVTINSYGVGKAIINAGNGTAVSLYNKHYILIFNIIARGAGRKEGNTKNGISIMNCTNINLDKLEITGFQKSGLMVFASSDVILSNLFAHDNGYAGIAVEGTYGKRDSKKIRISHCHAENNPGDPTNLTNHSGNGIVVSNCDDVVIEYSVANNNGWDMPRKGNGPVGIWAFEANNVTIQHCISYENKTSPGGEDGGGYDLDGGVTNSVIQYCLSYNNQGSGLGIFQYAGAGNWHDNTIRFNISENDGLVSTAKAGIYIWNGSNDKRQFRNCFIYNNDIYNPSGAAISYAPESGNEGFYFWNNIFVSMGQPILGKETGGKFLNNNWWTIKNNPKMQDENGVHDLTRYHINPCFAAPGQTQIVEPSKLHSFKNYVLPARSLLRTKGIKLNKYGISRPNKDFNGKVLKANIIGACY